MHQNTIKNGYCGENQIGFELQKLYIKNTIKNVHCGENQMNLFDKILTKKNTLKTFFLADFGMSF